MIDADQVLLMMQALRPVLKKMAEVSTTSERLECAHDFEYINEGLRSIVSAFTESVDREEMREALAAFDEVVLDLTKQSKQLKLVKTNPNLN